MLALGQFAPSNKLTKGLFLDLDVALCDYCCTTQIPRRFTKEVNFPPEYPFRSGVTKNLMDNFESLAKEIDSFLPREASVLEIGSNDGTLLSILGNLGLEVVGVEPTLAALESPVGFSIYQEYFENLKIEKEFNCVILTNTFAHLDDQRLILNQIARILTENGLLVIEVVDLDAMFARNEFDKFTHEHGVYFNEKTLDNLLKNFGFEKISTRRIVTHGGSLRSFYRFTGTCESIKEIDTTDTVSNFQIMKQMMDEIGTKLSYEIRNAKKSCSYLYLAGATTRGVTLLKSLGIDTNQFRAILEHPDSRRIGKIMPNLDLVVQSEHLIKNQSNTFVLVLAWHVAEEIIENLEKIRNDITFCIPLPYPRVM